MDLRIFIEPQQGASYDDQLRVAKATEEGGFDAFFRSDHYVAMGNRDGLPGPTDSWTTLAGLARETSRIRLGTLVSSATFRHPGVLAIQVAQVDQMSGGRVELGLGAGWFEREHQAYGIPFPSVGERFDRFSEQLEILTGLWSKPVGQTFSYDGKNYQLSDSPALPKPAQQQVPIIIGGSGKKRTPALAARFAAEFNANFASVEETKALYERVRGACQDAGRSPEDLKHSVALVVACGRDDAELARRAANLGRQVDELRENGLAGTPAEIVDKIGRYAEVGCQRIYLQVLDLDDIEHIELIAGEVLPQL
jgi:F420-dependent oxidoreductase-like protein